MFGWSIISNIISVILIYFYVPPKDAGLVNLVPQIVFLGIFTLMSLLVASGRLFDAVIDPLIAYYSDKSVHPKGRRIPFMKIGFIPSAIFCVLIFFPMDQQESMLNVWWLFFVQLLLYFFVTLYIIPYNALLPELASSSEEKVFLSTLQSFAFVVGMIIASQTPAFADLLEQTCKIESRQHSLQLVIAMLSVLAAISMAVPAFAIDEKKYCKHTPVSIPILPALKQAFANKSFRFFLVADFTYFISLTIIVSGLLYYVKILAGMEEAEGGKLMMVMVGLSLLFYPFMNKITSRVGKKNLILISLALLSLLFLGIYFVGNLPIEGSTHLYILFSLCSFPLTFLSIIPPALLAEIANADLKITGQSKEGIYYAVRFLFVKLGQTIGMMSFAIFLKYGKDVGDDMGLRLTGIAGGVLCLLGFLIFLKFDEKRLTK